LVIPQWQGFDGLKMAQNRYKGLRTRLTWSRVEEFLSGRVMGAKSARQKM